MSRKLEVLVWAAVLAGLSALVVAEGRERSDLERRVPIPVQQFYRTLARSQTTWQVVDVRGDLARGYEDARVPGALPMPGCDVARAPEAARDRILASVPTVIVTESGADGELYRCAAFFTSARVLAGGMEAWSDANLPEDSGEYSPPSAKAGGGCL
ncbi:MAG TPA: rhodanese-like domain-containing protein [Anaeromyxobacteraceae bacterium]|nr:rhodanese-like domain-containing protein [Anaeromyxobacteraceae bacterium]